MTAPAANLIEALVPTPASAKGLVATAKAAAGGDGAGAPSFAGAMAAAVAKAAGADQSIAAQALAGLTGATGAKAGANGAALPGAPGTNDDATDAAALLLLAANGPVVPAPTPPAPTQAAMDGSAAAAALQAPAAPKATVDTPASLPLSGAPGATAIADLVPQTADAADGLKLAADGGAQALAQGETAPKAAAHADRAAAAPVAPAPTPSPTPDLPAATRQPSATGGSAPAITLVADDAAKAAPVQTPPATLSGESAIVASEAARTARTDGGETPRSDRIRSRATAATATNAPQTTASAAQPETTAPVAATETRASVAQSSATIAFADLARREAAPGGAGDDKPDGTGQITPLATGTRHAPLQTAGARGAEAAAKAHQPAPPTPVVDQVVVHLRTALDQGIDRLDIRLKPASLGHITMKLDVSSNGHVTAVITADRPDTLNMLQRDARGLERALQDAGLQTDQGSLNFNLRGGGHFAGQQNGSGGFSGYGGGAHLSAPVADAHGSAPVEADPAPQRSARVPSNRALDIEV